MTREVFFDPPVESRGSRAKRGLLVRFRAGAAAIREIATRNVSSNIFKKFGESKKTGGRTGSNRMPGSTYGTQLLLRNPLYQRIRLLLDGDSRKSLDHRPS